MICDRRRVTEHGAKAGEFCNLARATQRAEAALNLTNTFRIRHG